MTKGIFSISKMADGSIIITVTDYDVEIMGGVDYEMNYSLDADSVSKLKAKLSEKHDGSLKQMVEAEFGPHLDKKGLSAWLTDQNIKYEFSSWIS